MDSNLVFQNLIEKKESEVNVHLGCGRYYKDGWINVDIPDEQSLGDIKVDVNADITKLLYPPSSIDKIFINHVFEHFSRVVALGLLVKWQIALKTEGILHIGTPDGLGIAKVIASQQASYSERILAVRHAMGSHEAGWGFHLDLWYKERFEHTLIPLGFKVVTIKETVRPYDGMRDLEVVAIKAKSLPLLVLREVCYGLLQESAINPVESKLVDVWKEMLDYELESVGE